MQAALILMTILGCDDSATNCHYVATAEQRWATVELCDVDSEKQLEKYSNVNYPMVVAVCQTPDPKKLAGGALEPESPPEIATAEKPPETPVVVEEPGLAARAMIRVRDALPTVSGMRNVVEKPVHFVADGYSWVARKFQK